MWKTNVSHWERSTSSKTEGLPQNTWCKRQDLSVESKGFRNYKLRLIFYSYWRPTLSRVALSVRASQCLSGFWHISCWGFLSNWREGKADLSDTWSVLAQVFPNWCWPVARPGWGTIFHQGPQQVLGPLNTDILDAPQSWRSGGLFSHKVTQWQKQSKLSSHSSQ